MTTEHIRRSLSASDRGTCHKRYRSSYDSATVPDDQVLLGPFDRLLRHPSGMPTAERRRRERAHADLIAEARLKRFAAGQIASREGEAADYLCVVQTGVMEVYTGDWESTKTVLVACGPGDMWGEVGLANIALAPAGEGNHRRPTRSSNVRAATPVVARTLAYSRVNSLRERHPLLNEILVELLADLVVRLTGAVRERDAGRSAAERVRACLLALVEETGTLDGTLSISQTELARRLQLHRGSVNRVLADERAAGRIATRNGASGLVVDIDALEDEVRRDRAG